jgi:ketosteroid isomerase-like protein
MKSLLTCLVISLPVWVMCQHVDSISNHVERLNRNIDNAVVEKDIAFLQKHYAEDFVFTHGTGAVDNREQWINAIKNPASVFLSRQHDSTTVEIHDDIAIVTGRLLIHRRDTTRSINYGLRYVRVFRKEKKLWQMISHRTTAEWHY